MGNRVVVGLIALGGLLQGLLPEAIPGVPMALAILGIIWGFMGVDAEDATAYLAVAIGVGMAGYSDALANIPAVGGYLDGIIDAASIALYSGVASVLVMRTWNRVKG
ncbi:MAG: hypothetical protein OXI11_10615 [Gammaproteobacteria bacterium]|nr:hypothetical protein [Gammaproteobacteria bacterium]MXW44753.1 hypothetical protein [Gammaproteobacteria bacterium]MYD01043.1 hypothetical protein [Gammaproteobacteria bacterium]MYI23949.1 hypothetical protein [Gammaproteobacteria bacterium]